MEYKINDKERNALCGLPYLQRLLYYEGMRPYMDYASGMVGIKRGISYQSLSEVLYVEPHPGYRGGRPSRDQIRRAVRGLEKSGLIQRQNFSKKLVLKCVLATQDYCVQNKAATKSPQQTAINPPENVVELSVGCHSHREQAARSKTTKATTPPVDNNYFYFLQKNFDIFWQQYPEKKSKQNAWAVFQAISPSAELCQVMLQALDRQIIFYRKQQAKGCWVPNWKHPANWLTHRCWEDDITLQPQGERRHDIHKTTDVFWESCQSGIRDEGASIAKPIRLDDYRHKRPKH